jgi:hypothetical protein
MERNQPLSALKEQPQHEELETDAYARETREPSVKKEEINA